MRSSPAALTCDESGWVEQVAGRLRSVQADAVGATLEQRHEHLREELP